jgi:hypothetical protein
MEPTMTQHAARIEKRRVVAKHLFDALCAQYPDKYIALIQPRDVVDDRLPAPELIPGKAPAAR